MKNISPIFKNTFFRLKKQDSKNILDINFNNRDKQ